MKHWMMTLCFFAAMNGVLLRAADDDKDKAERKAAIEQAKQERLAKLKEARDAKNKKPVDPKAAADKAKSEKAMADEKMAKDKAIADAKKAEEERLMKEDAYPDGTVVTVGGKMSIKALNAKAGVVCRLLATGGGKRDRTYNLIALNELATKIEAIRQNGDSISVTGTVYGDEINVEKIN